MKKIIVIGGGASGIFAAIHAAEGNRVTVIEARKRAAEKLLRTGNGRCNLTNLGSLEQAYSGNHPEFAEKVLSAFGPGDTIRCFASIGVPTREFNGWVYPFNEEASAVRNSLLREAERRGVKFRLNETVESVRPLKKGFEVCTAGWTYRADCVIVSCGSGASLPADTPTGYRIASKTGHTVIRPEPCLVSLVTRDFPVSLARGARARAKITLRGEDGASDTGQIQFTGTGISGIPVMNVSGAFRKHLDRQGAAEAEIDFMPEDPLSQGNDSDPEHSLAARGRCRGQNAFDSVYPAEARLAGILPARLAHALTAYCGNADKALKSLRRVRITVSDTGTLAEAQAASGGVDTGEIDPATMMSKKVPGLYFTGEMLDITGRCGGWNLQFAWATGASAGRHAGCLHNDIM